MFGYVCIYKFVDSLSYRMEVDILVYMISCWNYFCILINNVKDKEKFLINNFMILVFLGCFYLFKMKYNFVCKCVFWMKSFYKCLNNKYILIIENSFYYSYLIFNKLIFWCVDM